MFELQGLDHVALGVRDVERSASWYEDVLGFKRLHDDHWNGCPAMVGIGDLAVALFPVQADAPTRTPGKNPIAILHFAFRVDKPNFEAAQTELKTRSIEFEFQDHEIAQSIYFHDPDGHELEITTYEL